MATEVTTQLAEHPLSPRAELKAEKPEHSLRSHETDKPQKEPLVPGIVDFKVIQEALRTPKPQALGTYRFGHLSHHSFFSRHHPHPQRVTHIQDLTGRPVCVVRDKSSWSPLSQASLLSHYLMKMPTVPAPVGDPRSNRDPRLFSEAWKKELKDLASQVVTFSKENELKNKEEEPKREQGAKYSAETGRLIPASTRALSRRHSRQSPGSYTPSRDGGVQTFVLQDQELLILELLCQILQTDSLSAIQFWLPLVSIPTEKLLNQLQEVQEPPQERPQPSFSQSPKKSKTTALPKSEKPEHIGKAQVLRIHSSQNTEEKAPKPKPEFQGVCPALPTQL
ncbi:thymus, brain and testes associated [Phyllostomus discolor]|uniref:Thymus, brain and testes associated n=1 Tax=Phyllostomus discolor TaxID=89673 RepID=A0A834AIR6_9CHIR|nr:thymus, brain and testes associated [Phyllostomus discolor]